MLDAVPPIFKSLAGTLATAIAATVPTAHQTIGVNSAGTSWALRTPAWLDSANIYTGLQTISGLTSGTQGLKFVLTDQDTPYTPWSYFGGDGSYNTGAYIVISNKRQATNGTIQGVRAVAAQNDPFMLAVSPDINGSAIAVEGRATLTGGNDNCLAIAVHSLDDIVSGTATPYSIGCGRKKFGITGDGTMLWASELGITPATNADLKLYWKSAGLMGIGAKISGTMTEVMTIGQNITLSVPVIGFTASSISVLTGSALVTTGDLVLQGGSTRGVTLKDATPTTVGVYTENGSTGELKLGSTSSAYFLNLYSKNVKVLALTDTAVTVTDAVNFVFNTSTGTKLGTATGQKIGFWNQTPVVQQVLATGAGATVDNVITMLQTIGLCKQS